MLSSGGGGVDSLIGWHELCMTCHQIRCYYRSVDRARVYRMTSALRYCTHTGGLLTTAVGVHTPATHGKPLHNTQSSGWLVPSTYTRTHAHTTPAAETSLQKKLAGLEGVQQSGWRSYTMHHPRPASLARWVALLVRGRVITAVSAVIHRSLGATEIPVGHGIAHELIADLDAIPAAEPCTVIPAAVVDP